MGLVLKGNSNNLGITGGGGGTDTLQRALRTLGLVDRHHQGKMSASINAWWYFTYSSK